MAHIINTVNEKGKRQAMVPLFITCDPARDDPASLKRYLSEFHPDIIGLTGTYDDIKQTCKAFRVYFSTPPNVKPGQDYLVDHSIFFYLMDPENNFVEVYGRNLGPEEISKRIKGHIKDWEKVHQK
jgi:protein SCO1